MNLTEIIDGLFENGKRWEELTTEEQELVALKAQENNVFTPAPTPVPTPVEPPKQPTTGLYVPESTLSDYLAQNPNDPNFAKLKQVADQPTFIWLNGDETQAGVVQRVEDILKDANGQTVGFSLYAIPGRDGGGASAGGVQTIDDYNAYVGAIGYAIEKAGNPRVDVVVETDALGLNLPLAYSAINAATDILKKNSNTKVFLTASEWVEASDMAGRLKGAGVERADGVAVNVSGRMTFPKVEDYVKSVLSHLKPGLTYLIDTSRNGAEVPDGQWENTPGTKLGHFPQVFNEAQRYAYLWIKPPFESDGNSNGAGNAGSLWIAGLEAML